MRYITMSSRWYPAHGMHGRITDDDKRRMHEFATTPKYDRDPEMLVPDPQDVGDE